MPQRSRVAGRLQQQSAAAERLAGGGATQVPQSVLDSIGHGDEEEGEAGGIDCVVCMASVDVHRLDARMVRALPPVVAQRPAKRTELAAACQCGAEMFSLGLTGWSARR